MANPLDQFKIKPLVDISIGGFDISYTNSAFFMTIAVLLTTILMLFPINKRRLVPNKAQSAVELYYQGLAGMLRGAAGAEAKKYFPFIFCVFTFILMGNVLGMMPFSFTYTSHIAVTFGLALLVLSIITIIGFARHGLHFFSLFMPDGAPLYLAPLLIPIEVFSYLMRPVSLALRLFANMMVGHVLLKVIAGFVATLGLIGWGVIPFGVVIVLTGFELFIAVLQAYIFTMLSCVYLKDAIHLH